MEMLKDLFGHLHKEFAWFLWGLVLLGFIWFLMGGVNNDTAHEGPYIKPLEPLNTGQVYGQYYAGTPAPVKETLNLPEWPADAVRSVESYLLELFSKPADVSAIHAAAIAAKGLYLDGTAGAKSTDPEKEYVRIVSSADAIGPIKLSGLALSGTSGISVIIPGAVFLPLPGSGQLPLTQNVYLKPGDRALVTTGVSPIGASFQTNSCTGYLNELGTFTPALRMSCPDGSQCKTDEAKGFTYSSCVAAHKNDPDFYSGEWRIFLDRDSALWRDALETIRLMDENGKAIDAIAY